MGAEDAADRGAFGAVVDRGAGAVGVDVADRLRGEAGVAQRPAHRPLGAVPGSGSRCRWRRRSSRSRSPRRGSPRRGRGRGRSSSKTKTAAPSPWTMPLRLSENGRQPSRDITRRPSQALMPPKHSIDLAAAGQHHVGLAGADQVQRLAHRVVRRGAGRGDGVARALQVPRHRDVAGGGVVHQPRHDEGMNAVLPLLVDEAVVLVLGLQPAARGAEDHARRARRGPRRSRGRTAPSPRARRAARTGRRGRRGSAPGGEKCSSGR